MVEHFSHKIQNVIQKELFRANSSIKIAVAWFTNELLLYPLVLKQQTGVTVEIIINDDNINRGGESSLDFTDFFKAGGHLRWNNSKQLMHEKFCVIDDRVVIFGSYNWTNKAEINEESITISRDELDTINFYCKKFELLSAKYQLEVNIGKLTTSTVKDSAFEKSAFTSKVAFDSFIINKACKKTKIPKVILIYDERGTNPDLLSPYSNLYFYDKIDFSKNDLIIAKKDNKLCLLDKQSFLPLTSFIFDSFSTLNLSGSLIWLRCNGKWGLYDIEKKDFCIQPVCDSFKGESLFNSFFEIVINNKHGVADINGNIVLNCLFDEVIIRKEDIYEVRLGDKWGIFNSGRFMVEFDSKRYDFITMRNGKYGLVTYEGCIVLDFVYDMIIDCDPHYSTSYYLLIQNGKYGLRKNGKTIPCIYDSKDELPI